MAFKEYESEKKYSQNINDKTSQESSSSQTPVLDNNLSNPQNKEAIPQLSEEEKTNLDKKRNTADFQQGLQDILPKDAVIQKKEPKNMNALMQQWQKDSPKVDPKQTNATGLPDKLKAGIENLSGLSMDDVKVHYNSSKPAEVGALAYTQGMDIHLASGQEKHLAHELAHIVQQKEGRVKPTTEENGTAINDDAGLEKEADVMGAKALKGDISPKTTPVQKKTTPTTVTQKKEGDDARIENWISKNGHAHLFKGINESMNETAIIGALIENFYNRTDFDYTFSASAAFSGSGDCSTLSKEFITIAKDVFQIEGMATESGDKGYLIQGGGKIVHKAPVAGNIDGGAHWFFESHTWALWNGKPIDVLFGQLGIKDHQPNIKGTPNDGGVEYTGGDFPFYLKAEQTTFDKYTTNPALKMSGVKIAKGKKGTEDPNSKFAKLF